MYLAWIKTARNILRGQRRQNDRNIARFQYNFPCGCQESHHRVSFSNFEPRGRRSGISFFLERPPLGPKLPEIAARPSLVDGFLLRNKKSNQKILICKSKIQLDPIDSHVQLMLGLPAANHRALPKKCLGPEKWQISKRGHFLKSKIR
eukprot:c19740_g1_i1.p1 GENE.c19740_g1_i1~~c19740_g1_i1.p1  ORF type:complete len:148 (-),score=24.75 c19740_g1_i1:135-578(-)